MTHVVRLLVLISLFGTASRGPAQGSQQTKTIGSDRLVSVSALPEMTGEMCAPVAAGREEILLAAMQWRQDARDAALAARPVAAQNRGTAQGRRTTQDRSQLKPIRWIRDPYAVYARAVLRLEPMDPIDQDPSYAERGSILHEAVDLHEREPARIPQGDLAYAWIRMFTPIILCRPTTTR